MKNKQGKHNAPKLRSLSILPGKSCDFYTDSSRYNDSDFVIIKYSLFKDKDDMPNYRPPGQRWIYYVWESRIRSPEYLFPENWNKFNYTMTYSKHADIFYPYGEFQEHRADASVVNASISQILQNKTKRVVWMISDCLAANYRENYGRELMRHIHVDVYGDCGNMSCPKRANCQPLISQYKFYLAFENSLCGEYITEKVYRSFEWGMVPVVYGAMEKYNTLPHHSYIHVADFSSPEKLAEYLLLLDRNDSLYREYFSWRYKYTCTDINMTKKSQRICCFLHANRYNNHTVQLDSVWTEHSHRCEDPVHYLHRLGVVNLNKKAFSMKSTKHKGDEIKT